MLDRFSFETQNGVGISANVTLRRGVVSPVGCVLAAALALSTVPAMAGCNSGSAANTNLLSSGNCQAVASGINATAVGSNAQATALGTTAIGGNAFALKDDATAIGYFSGANEPSAGAGSTAIGARAGASGTGIWSIAIGAGAQSDLGANALGPGSIAIGAGESVDFPGARASGNAGVAIGNRSVAGGDGYGSAFGYNARADIGLAPTAVGTDSTARGTNAAAFGRFSSAMAEDSTALGSGALASRRSAVAIGHGSIADAPNTVSVGSVDKRRRIVNVAKGLNPSDAVNLAQVRQLIAAAAAASGTSSAGMATAPLDSPAVSVVRVGGAGHALEELRRELAELRTLVRQQQQRIVHLESRVVAAAHAK